jgi:hypothetical protein
MNVFNTYSFSIPLLMLRILLCMDREYVCEDRQHNDIYISADTNIIN